MSKTLLILSALLLVAGAISISAHLASPVSAAAPNVVANPEPDRLTLWNEDHVQIVDMIGEWRVRSAPNGSRMRPQHDECYIRLMADASGDEYELRVTTVGEVYIAHGWIAVNQVNQDTWTAAMPEEPASSSCGNNPLDCTSSYLKSEVVRIVFEPNSCWQAVEQPAAGCAWTWNCSTGSTGCTVHFHQNTGVVDAFESSCGSNAKITQCKNASGLTWICFCS